MFLAGKQPCFLFENILCVFMESQDNPKPTRRLADWILDILMAPDEKKKKAAETALEKTEVGNDVIET
jgi:hypothetical protein